MGDNYHVKVTHRLIKFAHKHGIESAFPTLLGLIIYRIEQIYQDILKYHELRPWRPMVVKTQCEKWGCNYQKVKRDLKLLRQRDLLTSDRGHNNLKYEFVGPLKDLFASIKSDISQVSKVILPNEKSDTSQRLPIKSTKSLKNRLSSFPKEPGRHYQSSHDYWKGKSWDPNKAGNKGFQFFPQEYLAARK